MSYIASELIGRVAIMGAKQAMSDLEGVGKASDSAAAKLARPLVMGGALAATAIATIGVVSLKMAGDYEQATNTLVTSAGLQRSSLDAVRQGILKMSVDTGTSTDQLVKGMFNVQSALHLGAGGLQVLKAAAEGAKAENSDLAQTTDVLTTAMVNYHLGAQQAAGTMNSLIVTVAAGKMHMNDLTGALKNVLPVSASLQVKLSDVEGALATMANAGDRGTSAGTHLAMMFKMLSNPIGAAKSEMAAMGLNSVDLANTMRTSLPAALQMIQDAVAQHFVPGSVQYQRAIMTILGGSKSGIAGLEIFGQGMKQLQQNTDDAAAALRRGGKDVDNWTVIQSGLNFQLDRAHRAFDSLFIQLGMHLLPVVTPLVQRFADFVSTLSHLDMQPVTDAFSALLNNAIAPLVQKVQDLWQGAVNLFQAFQQGQAYANAIAIGLGTIGTAIAAIKLEEFIAGMYNAFNEMSAGAGIIATVANNALPELGQALGWVKGQAVASSVAVQGIGVASVEAEGVVVASSAAMTLALGAATLGISLLVGAVIAGIVASTVRGQTAMTASTKKAYDSLGQTSADMKAKQQADATVVNVTWSSSANSVGDRWQVTGRRIGQASADARAKFIIDQQKMRDAATAAAAAADAAWVQASQDMNLAKLYQLAGYSPGPHYGQPSGSTFTNYQGQTVSNASGSNARAEGGPITEPVIGIGLRTGERWSFGERGPEMVVPFGGRTSHTSPQTQSSGASNQPINLQIDGRTFARLILPHIVGNIRTATGVQF